MDSCALGGPGDLNAAIDPGETITMFAVVGNQSSVAATNVNAVVTSLTPGVVVTQANAAFGDIGAFEMAQDQTGVVYNVELTVPCASEVRLAYEFFFDEGTDSDICTVFTAEACNPCTDSPILDMAACPGEGLLDTCVDGGPGDMNGRVDPGESVMFSPSVINTGATATNVSATFALVGAPAGVTLTDNTVFYGDIAMGQVAMPAPGDTIDFSTEAGVGCGTEIQFEVTITSAEGSFTRSCSLTTAPPAECEPCASGPLPVLDPASCTVISDSCAAGGPGDADGNADPGESISFSPVINNIGGAEATNVMATVATGTPCVTITAGTTSFGTIGVGGSATAATPIEFDVGLACECPTEIVLEFTITSDAGPAPTGMCSVVVPVECNPCGPQLVVDACGPSDSCGAGGPGDGDGQFEPGESGALAIVLANNGSSAANNVTMTAAGPPYVAFTNNTANYGNIAAGTTATGDADITFDIDEAVPCDGRTMAIELTITSDEGTFFQTCSYEIPVDCDPCTSPVVLATAGCDLLGDSCEFGGFGDANGFLDPGESGTMSPVVENVGTETATGVSITVTTENPCVTVTQGTSTYPDIDPSSTASAETPIEFSLDATCPCDSVIVFDIAITSNETSANRNCEMPIAVNCTVCEILEGPALAYVGGSVVITSDSCGAGGPGDMNGAIDPGESISISVEVENTGTEDANNVSCTATVTAPAAGVTLTTGTTTFGTIAMNGSGTSTADLEFTVNGAVPCGEDIEIDLTCDSDEGNTAPVSTVTELAVADPCDACAGVSVDPVIEVVTHCNTDGSLEVAWVAALGADTHHVHRGTLAALAGQVYDHATEVCEVAMPAVTALSVSNNCTDGEAVYFLVVGEDSASGLRSEPNPFGMGWDMAGMAPAPRPASAPDCP